MLSLKSQWQPILLAMSVGRSQSVSVLRPGPRQETSSWLTTLLIILREQSFITKRRVLKYLKRARQTLSPVRSFWNRCVIDEIYSTSGRFHYSLLDWRYELRSKYTICNYFSSFPFRMSYHNDVGTCLRWLDFVCKERGVLHHLRPSHFPALFASDVFTVPLELFAPLLYRVLDCCSLNWWSCIGSWKFINYICKQKWPLVPSLVSWPVD